MNISASSSASSSLISNISSTNQRIGESAGRLSSGTRNFLDDPASLAIAQGLNTEVRVGSVSQRNINDGFSVINIAEGSLGQVKDITMRMQELTMQSSSGILNDAQRGALNQEYQALKEEIGRIGETTEFNGLKLFSGEKINIQAGDVTSIELPSLGGLALPDNISTQSAAIEGLDSLQAVTDLITTTQTKLGAQGSRLQTQFNNLQSSEIAKKESQSKMQDTDFASEAINFKNSIIGQQANIAVLAQANQSQARVLDLIKTR